MSTLQGERVLLRPATLADVPALMEIRRTPEVYRRWGGGDDLVAAVEEDLAEPGTVAYVIELDGRFAGWIQWHAEEEPDYRSASSPSASCAAMSMAPTAAGTTPCSWTCSPRSSSTAPDAAMRIGASTQSDGPSGHG